MVLLPTGTSQTATYGAAVSIPFVGIGDTGPYTYSSVGNPLPKGMTVNPATGELTGTPQETGTFSITIRATDSKVPATTFQRTYSLDITAGSNTLTLAYPTQSGNSSMLPNRLRSSTIQHRIDVSGGTAPYTWSITEGSLPAGVFLLSGTSTPNGYPTDGASAALVHLASHGTPTSSGAMR